MFVCVFLLIYFMYDFSHCDVCSFLTHLIYFISFSVLPPDSCYPPCLRLGLRSWSQRCQCDSTWVHHMTHTLTHTYTRRSRTLSWCWEVQSFGTNGAVTAANIHGDTNRSELLFPWRRTDADGVKPFPALHFSSWFSRFYIITPRVTPPVRQVSPTSQKTQNGNKRKTGGEIKQQTTEKQKWIWTTADGKSNNVSV